MNVKNVLKMYQVMLARFMFLAQRAVYLKVSKGFIYSEVTIYLFSEIYNNFLTHFSP